MKEEEQSGQRLWSPFADPTTEKLFRSYSGKQKRSGLLGLVAASLLLNLHSLLAEAPLPARAALGVAALLHLVLCGWLAAPRQRGWAVLPLFAWLLCAAVLAARLCTWGLQDALGWVLLLDYLVYVGLPLRLPWCALLAVGLCTIYLLPYAWLEPQLIIVSECILLVTSNALGLISFLADEKQQRRAFLQTRQSLEAKLAIEERSAEQERLLLSVLPEHVAVQMRQDLSSPQDISQFKKIYMSRHENVSILYADIVGFTAISSTYSAQDLVKILNELFARFDRLAELYQQLRIKILGDCYYCISGAPMERKDHAILCVHMGLSMVKAIKYVQQKTNSPVDMRVGIHTGAVLAGVLGQRQWQFDVYSKDVELANKMESSGMAGRVHVSEKTLAFLDGHFEVEPAYGEKREEALRLAGLRTFFIVKVLVPFAGGTPENEDETSPDNDYNATINDEDDQPSAINEKDFEQRLKKELVNRDGYWELSKHTNRATLSFSSGDSERAYRTQEEPYSAMNLHAFFIIRLALSGAQFLVLPRRPLNLISFGAGSLILGLVSAASLADSRSFLYRAFNGSAPIRSLVALLCVLALAITHLVDIVSCSEALPSTDELVVGEGPPGEESEEVFRCPTGSPETYCMQPSHLGAGAVLVLVAVALPVALAHFVKGVLLIGAAGAQCAVSMLLLEKRLACEDPTRAPYTRCLTLGGVAVALVLLARHSERVSRVLFLWRAEAEQQRERASDLRRRNEALLHNVLPPHVARHFMGVRARSHDHLYSQSYAEVGVLFASMPNFTDFYSEESVNNQGLECLRFLNEVISDFDALLEHARFRDIIKIKTIGSTYMAASGLNPSTQPAADAPVEVRWAHLSLLVEFALELKRALHSINEQSFNHFVLKMGINHGPITAGVIGARKPHYDIWGNTVNVASRMESTGKAGCVQVTEETCAILKHFGYTFEQRGLVAVKGKGQLMTYYLMDPSAARPEPIAEEDEVQAQINEDACLLPPATP